MKTQRFLALCLFLVGLVFGNLGAYAQGGSAAGGLTPMGEKLIWQDDFGTFTEKGKYWVWDYSDINNPLKVEKTTKDGWTYELSDSIPGAEYDSDV
ncbi:MAG: hypothetical protein E7077_08545, partial [Bacteroidales bacterium]|nr:hypothetical protein [Bacteroidales bacterium]